MNKDRNVVSLTEVCDIDESPSSSKNLDVLNEIDTEFMRFSKALLRNVLINLTGIASMT